MCTRKNTYTTRCGCIRSRLDICRAAGKRTKDGACYNVVERSVTDEYKICEQCIDKLRNAVIRMKDKRGMVNGG